LGSRSEEEEEIEIPKSRNSSTYPPPPFLQSIAYASTTGQLHRERAVPGRIFQALPTQTVTTVALIYRIDHKCHENINLKIKRRKNHKFRHNLNIARR
jgi:hypothetical protein